MLLALCLTAAAELFTSPKVVAQFGRQNPARYFGIVEHNLTLIVYARTGSHGGIRIHDAALGLAATTTSRAMGRGASLARRLDWRPGRRRWRTTRPSTCRTVLWVVGGLWGPGAKKRGLEKRGPFATVDELLASEEGPVLVQGDHEVCGPTSRQRGACEFKRVSGGRAIVRCVPI